MRITHGDELTRGEHSFLCEDLVKNPSTPVFEEVFDPVLLHEPPGVFRLVCCFDRRWRCEMVIDDEDLLRVPDLFYAETFDGPENVAARGIDVAPEIVSGCDRGTVRVTGHDFFCNGHCHEMKLLC